MQKNLQTAVEVVTQTQDEVDTSRTLSAPIELDLAQLQQVGGGMAPNGTWADAASPNGTW